MAELERERVEVVGVASRPVANPVTLPELVQRARNSAGQETEWLAGLINERLEALGPGAGPEVGPLLLEWIEDGAFEGLVAGDGWACRAAAVAAVLELGYPHALSLDPDDLEFLRAERERVPRERPQRNVAALGGLVSSGLLAVLAAAFNVGASFPADPTVVALTVGPPVVAAASMAGVLGSARRSPLRFLSVLGGAASAALYGSFALVFGGSMRDGLELTLLGAGGFLAALHLWASASGLLDALRPGQASRSQRTS